MTAPERPAGSWPVGFRVRPPVEPSSPHVEVADTVTGRRFRWAPEALAEQILGGGVGDAASGDRGRWLAALESAPERERLLPGWRHWQDRGWYPSDQYYVASRRWVYADATDADRSIRARTVENYLVVDGRPPEPRRLDGPRVGLGVPAEPGDQEVSRLLVRRRSGRAYVPEPVGLERLSGLLWYGLAEVRRRREATDPSEPLSYLDSYCSAFDVYLCVYGVDGLDPGVYRYEMLDHELTGVRPGDHRQAMTGILQGMHSPATAGWTLSLVADFPRYQWRYRHEHGLRRIYLESGILAQELLLLAMSYGLGTLVTPAQQDRPYLALHDLPAERYAPVYTLTMGWSRGAAGSAFNGQQIEHREPDRS